MSFQERQHMKSIDRLILGATPEELAKIQELDMSIQLDGKSFYDACAESRIPPLARLQRKHSHS